jgi:hypothetical protein
VLTQTYRALSGGSVGEPIGSDSYRSRSGSSSRSGEMIVLDPPLVAAIATLVTATAALVWAIRRKP